VIKQFNFYDIYGYFIPGMLLVGVFWLPFGMLTQSWPAQDLSNALFLAVLSYILGHIVQTIAPSLIPSTVLDEKKQRRFYSDIYLDYSNNSKFGVEFKEKLAAQVSEMFGLNLDVAQDVVQDEKGKSAISTNRQTAFFQARFFLVAKKAAHYAEQNEGLYAMMRGLACSFCAGALYLAGWGLSFHYDQLCLRWTLAILLAIGVGGALVSSCIALLPNKDARKAVVLLALFLILALLCSGFWIGAEQPGKFWSLTPAHADRILWASACLAIIAATRCLSFYKYYTDLFAQTVWRDFSAYLSFQQAPTSTNGVNSDES